MATCRSNFKPGSADCWHLTPKHIIDAILRRVEDGNFGSSYKLAQATKITRIWGRDPDWRELGKDYRPISLFCDHLGGDASVKWYFEWDPGLRDDTTGGTEKMELEGGDVYCPLG